MLVSFIAFALYGALAITASAVLLGNAAVSQQTAFPFAIAVGLLLVGVGGVHFDRLNRAGASVWNATGPQTLDESQWHDLLFSRILFWTTSMSFGILVLAHANVVDASAALLVMASFGVPVAVVWVASALRFDAQTVKQIKLK